MKKELRSSGRTILKLLNHLSIARIEVLKSAGGGEQNTCNTSTDEEVVCKRRGGDIRMGAEEWSAEHTVYEEAVMKPVIFYANFFKGARKIGRNGAM